VPGQLAVLRTLPNGDDVDQLSYPHVDSACGRPDS